MRASILMRGTPACFRSWQAWTAEPPVASMGSTTMRQGGLHVAGQLVVVLGGQQGFLVSVHAEVPDLGLRQQFEQGVRHAQARRVEWARS